MNWNFGNFASFVKKGDPGSPLNSPSTNKFLEFFYLNLLITLTQDAHLKKDCKTFVLTLSQRRVGYPYDTPAPTLCRPFHSFDVSIQSCLLSAQTLLQSCANKLDVQWSYANPSLRNVCEKPSINLRRYMCQPSTTPLIPRRPRANPAQLQAPSFVNVVKQKCPYEARQTIESLECLGSIIE